MSKESRSTTHIKTEAESSEGSEHLGANQNGSQKSKHGSVSRPPSGHLSRVDEEPSTTDSSKERCRVETVDRGVGPTPLPPQNVDPRLPPYFGVHPQQFLDPRNGILESSPYGCSILMASAMRQVALASKTSLARRFFSRTALPQLRVSQGDVSSQSRNFDHFILPAALVLTVFGVSVSLFSTHQLSYNSCRSLKK